MDDKQRTKLLAMGLGAVVAVYSLRSTVDEILMKPIRDLQKKFVSVEMENESLQRRKIELQVAQRNLEDWKATSLPRDIDDAQRLYREWVYELTRQCGFSGPGFEVTPGSRNAQKEYHTVSVEIKKAETDLQGLTRFLYLFDQSNILHRIAAMKIDSPGTQGNPRLLVSLTAEGMSVTGGEDKKELLPRSSLTGKLTETTNEILVVPNESFPTWDPFEPFLVRVDRELLKVESVSGGFWKVQRGAEGTKAMTHEENAVVELLPVAWDRKEKTLSMYAEFVKGSPFVIPSPPKTWNPRLTGVADKTIKPGEEVKFTARAESLNPDLGEPQFALTDAVEGMTIDPVTGEFQWQPAADLAPGKYSATVLLTQAKNPTVSLNTKLQITIKSTNVAPVLTVPESAIVVLGREFTARAMATDDGPAEALKFYLGSAAPEGLAIDSATGELKWNPPRTFTPAKYDVEVTVTDGGEEPKTTSKKISLDVQDDNAALTRLTGALAKDSVWFAWFRNYGTGKTERLKVGDRLNVSEISVEVASVSNRFVTLKDPEGIWKLALGDTLRDRKLIEPAPKPEPTSSGSTEDTPPIDPATPADGVKDAASVPAKEESPVDESVPAPLENADGESETEKGAAEKAQKPAAPETTEEEPVAEPVTT